MSFAQYRASRRFAVGERGSDHPEPGYSQCSVDRKEHAPPRKGQWF